MSPIIKASLLILCLCFVVIDASEAIPYSFETLTKAKEGELITIRGFLYENEHGELFLSSQPNLKSCCIGKNKQDQILALKDAEEKVDETDDGKQEERGPVDAPAKCRPSEKPQPDHSAR